MKLWKLLDTDVVKNGTPSPCWKLLDAAINGWNKCMGNVDTICETLRFHKTKRGSNTKLVFLLWRTTFQYMLYQAFWIYMYSKMKKHE